MKYPFTLIFLTCISFNSLLAQAPAVFEPAISDSVKLAAILQQARVRFKEDSASITGENKKYHVNILRERFNYLQAKFKAKEFLYTDELNEYFQQILNEIVKNNPTLQPLPVRLLLSRSYIPNAASVGEGSLYYHAGLFYKLRNEAEVAFALSHELAHFYLNHGNNAIKDYINTVYSDEYQEKLKEIKKTKYEQGKLLDDMAKKLYFRSSRHGREKEAEADSMAVFFLKNTRFDIKSAIQGLAILDSIDNSKFDVDKRFPEIFDFPDYKFQPRWLQKEEGLFGSEKSDFHKTTAEEDSLKTHPDCKLRLKKVTPLADKVYAAGKKENITTAKFEKIQLQLRYEAIDYCFKTKDVSRCLFLTLEMLEDHPGDMYLVTMAGKCFYQIYKNQKEHTLGTIVDMPSYLHEKNYNRLLEFIQNLRLWDIAGIGHHYLTKYKTAGKGNLDFEEVAEKMEVIYNKEFK